MTSAAPATCSRTRPGDEQADGVVGGELVPEPEDERAHQSRRISRTTSPSGSWIWTRSGICPGKAVGGAAVAGVVRAEGHLELVQQSVVDLATRDQPPGRLVDGHRDPSGVVLGGDDQVGAGDEPALVGAVVVDQCPAWGLDDADPLLGGRGRERAHVGAEDLGIGGELGHPLRCVHELDDPRPVVGERVVDGLASERGHELLVGLLRERRRHSVAAFSRASGATP